MGNGFPRIVLGLFNAPCENVEFWSTPMLPQRQLTVGLQFRGTDQFFDESAPSAVLHHTWTVYYVERMQHILASKCECKI